MHQVQENDMVTLIKLLKKILIQKATWSNKGKKLVMQNKPLPSTNKNPVSVALKNMKKEVAYSQETEVTDSERIHSLKNNIFSGSTSQPSLSWFSAAATRCEWNVEFVVEFSSFKVHIPKLVYDE